LTEDAMIEALRATGEAFDERLTRSMLKAASPDPFAVHTATTQQAKPDQGLTYQSLINFMEDARSQQKRDVWLYATTNNMPAKDENGSPLAVFLHYEKVVFCHPDTLGSTLALMRGQGITLVPFDPTLEKMPEPSRRLVYERK
jgi:hypothetical protein